MYPPVSPHGQGLLDVGDGFQVYWEESGNPEGIPVLYLHGGPGSSLTAGYRRKFDPQRYRIIGVQQRGAGLSTPHASDAAHRIELNSTRHLLDDLDAVRAHLGIDAWLVCGVSWGCTLALHHALRNRDAVLGLVLVAVTTTSPAEVEWITEGVGMLYPEAWDRLARVVEGHSDWRRGHGRLVEAVATIMASDDAAVRAEMAVAWMEWEDSHVQIGLPLDELRPVELCEWPIRDQVAFVSLVTHYWSNHARLDPEWVPTGGILAHAHELAGLPICLVHGRRDVSGPVSIPWALKGQVPGARMHVVESEGHGGERMMELWCEATDSFAACGDFSRMASPR